MLEIVKLKNPFDKTQKEVTNVKYVIGQCLTDYIENNKEFEFVLNGKIVEYPNLTVPLDNDQIIIMKHVGSGAFKKILATIASMWLMGFVGKIANGTLAGMAGHATLASYLAAGAVMYVGGRIINAVFPTGQSTSSSNNNSSPTYGWDSPSTISGEGGIIGQTYGECIPAPQLLAKHVETVNGKQYLNLLLCGGQGEIDSITDIKIGDTAIENFSDVQIETRLGTNDQEPISFFTDTPTDQSVGLDLTETGVIQTCASTTATSLEVTLEFPSGLYYVNDKGNFANTTVEVDLFYRKTGTETWNAFGSDITSSTIANATCYPDAPGETWDIRYDFTTEKYIVTGSVTGRTADATAGVAYDNGKIKFTIINNSVLGVVRYVKGTIVVTAGAFVITGAQNTAIRKSKRINGLTAGQYDVKAVVKSRSTGSRYCTNVTWSVLSAYNAGKYSRPGKVLVGLRILATNQLSGSVPDVTWRQTRNTVYVWNPITNAYEPKSARNPIWASYDIYHQCRYLKNINTNQMEYYSFGVDHERLDPYFDEWVECANYADEQVLSTDGVTYEKRFEFDYFFDTELKRYEAAQRAATVGHATIMPRGNNIGIKVDKPATMTQIFGEGRITQGSLQGTFSATEDRALAIDITFPSTENDFKNTSFQVRSPKWNQSKKVQDNPTSLTLFGVKRKSQAYREGMYHLANNEQITQFIDISTDINAIDCEYGDVVGINHSVSQIGVASGRIVNATTNTVALDKEVELLSGKNYEITLFLSDNSIIKKNIVPVSQTTQTDTITVTEPFTTIPAQFDNYSLGEVAKSVKKFRIVGMKKGIDLTCKLNLAEYSEGIYTGDLNYPILDYTPPVTKIAEVINLQTAEESYISADGVNVSKLQASWNLDRDAKVDNFLVYYSTDNSTWKYLKTTTDMFVTIENVDVGTTYYIKVKTVKDIIISSGVVSSPLLICGNMLTPQIPNGMSVTFSDKCVWVWNSQESNVDYWELRSNSNVGNTVGLYAKTSTNTATFTPATRSGQVFLFAHNKNNIYSEPLIFDYSKPEPIAPTNIEIKDIFQGIVISCDALPAYCLGVNFHVNDGTGDIIYFSQNNSYTYKTTGGIFDIQVAFVDIFGEGVKSTTVQKIIKATIDPALLEAESISLEKMDTVIQEAIAKAQNGVDTTAINNAIADINTDISTITNTTIPNLQTDLQGKIDTVNAGMTALDSAKVSHTEFTATSNTLTQADAENRSLITQNANSITAMVGKLNSSPDATDQYTSISTLKQMADSISLTVANKANVADLTITNNSITNMVAKLNSAPNATDQYTAISTLKQTADALASTVTSNKADADGKITTANSNITQNANSITATIAELNKDPFSATPPAYTAFSKIKQTTDSINTTVATKANAADLTISNNNITAMVAKLNSAPDAVGQYTAISTLKQTADVISTTVSNIAVGGRNLRSEVIPTVNNTACSIANSILYIYKGTKSFISTANSLDLKYLRLSNGISFKAGALYTASLYVYDINNIVSHLDYVDNSSSPAIINSSVKTSLGNSYYKYVITVKPTVTGIPTHGFLFYNNGAIGNIFYVSGIKIEEGNMATDWTPAPEDIDYSISQINQTTASITSTVTANKTAQDAVNTTTSTAISQMNSDIQLRATKANLVSLINVCPEAISLKSSLVHIAGDTVIDDNVIVGRMLSANSITADKIATGSITISNLNTATQNTITTAQTTANTAVANAATAQSTANTATTLANTAQSTVDNLAIGGRNLFENSANSTVYSGNTTNAEHVYFASIQHVFDKLNIGDEITISFDVQMAKGLYLQVYNNNWDGDIIFSPNKTFTNIGTNKQRLFFTTKVATNTDASKGSPLNTWIEFYSIYGSSDWYTISKLKIEKGNKATDWTPAPEDTQTTINTTLVNQNLALTFNHITNVTITGNCIEKTSGVYTSWDASCSATRLLYNGDYAEYTVGILGRHIMFGLSSSWTNANYTSIDFAIYQVSNNVVQIYELGACKSTPSGTLAIGDKLRVSIENNKINYYKNGVLLYTSLTTPTLPMVLDTSFYIAGDKVNNVTIGSMLSGVQEGIATAQSTADIAKANALTAQNTANTAVTNAGTANSLLADIASDAKLTPNEKVTTKQMWDSIGSEYTLNLAQATTFGITTTKTAYTTAYTALNTYITPLLTSLITTSAIVRATFNANFKAYYDARTNLLNAIALKAKTLADTAQTQANTATTNASTAQTAANTASTNATTANNQINAWKKTGTTQINGGVIATNSVTADKLQIGSTSGARTEIINNLIRVYDANNVLRVRLGVW